MKGKISFVARNVLVKYDNRFKCWVLVTHSGFDVISRETAISLRKDYDNGKLYL